VTDGFPVLSAGPTPHTPLEQWTFSITQGGQTRKSWTWQEFRALPAETITADIHCVTRWSKLDTVWQGVERNHVNFDGAGSPSGPEAGA
jgi:DMSO/TMAO reductase YedYZ molybdopterin-dependent catalytic subunit